MSLSTFWFFLTLSEMFQGFNSPGNTEMAKIIIWYLGHPQEEETVRGLN